MRKDVERLREEEARLERERIKALKTEEEARKERERLERIRKMEEERRKAEEERRRLMALKIREEERKRREEEERERKIVEEIRRRALEEKKKRKLPTLVLPKKPSLFDKILIRLLILAILFLFFFFGFTFWYWYFKIRPAPEVLPPKIEEIKPTPSPITIKEEKIYQISRFEQIPLALTSLLKEDLDQENFYRVLFKTENRFLTLKEIFNSLKIKTPLNFYQKIGKDFTFFVFQQKEGKRLGFLIKIKEKEDLLSLLSLWEKTMEKDWEDFFKFLGKEKEALVPFFREKTQNGIKTHFQTYTLEDLGMIWAIDKDWLIFCSSFQSFEKIIPQL